MSNTLADAFRHFLGNHSAQALEREFVTISLPACCLLDGIEFQTFQVICRMEEYDGQLVAIYEIKYAREWELQKRMPLDTPMN